MKILSWNVNGLQSIIRKGFNDIVAKLDNDVICIQELKTTKEIKGFKLEGYYSYYNYVKSSLKLISFNMILNLNDNE